MSLLCIPHRKKAVVSILFLKTKNTETETEIYKKKKQKYLLGWLVYYLILRITYVRIVCLCKNVSDIIIFSVLSLLILDNIPWRVFKLKVTLFRFCIIQKKNITF